MVLLAIHGRFWSFRFHCFLSALFCGSNMCTQVSSPVSKLEMTQQFLQKFLVIFKVLCLMLLSEQMRYPPNANLSQVQTLFSKLSSDMPVQLAISLTDNRSILFDHNLYWSDVSLGNRGFRPSRMGIIFNRKFPSLKSFNPPKICAHWKGLRSIYTTNSLNICFESILSLMRHLI